MVKQAQINWVASNGSPGGITIHHFMDAATAGSIRTTLRAMIAAVDNCISNQWTIQEGAEIRILNTATGQLTGSELIIPQAPVVGIETGQPVADSTCGLVRYQTGIYQNGRQVRGRTFIPGIAAANLALGQWAAPVPSLLTAFGEAFRVDPNSVIYSRPLGARPGTVTKVSAASAWEQCAVLRHRRQR